MLIDKTLYTKIYKMALDCTSIRGLDRSYASDITQEVCIVLIYMILDGEKESKIKNFDHFLFGIVIRKATDVYRRQKKDDLAMSEFNFLIDKFQDVDIDLIINQAKSFSMIIDDLIAKDPSLFTEQNKKLWELFKVQKYTVPEMMEKVNMTRANFYVAKARLIEKLISIYGNYRDFKLK